MSLPPSVLLKKKILLSSFSNPTVRLCWVFVCVFISVPPDPVKWPYQVPRYVSDAAPHVPALRFGKEMPAESRVQGRSTFSSETPQPLLTQPPQLPLSPPCSPLCSTTHIAIGLSSGQLSVLCSAVFPRISLFDIGFCCFFSSALTMI